MPSLLLLGFFCSGELRYPKHTRQRHRPDLRRHDLRADLQLRVHPGPRERWHADLRRGRALGSGRQLRRFVAARASICEQLCRVVSFRFFRSVLSLSLSFSLSLSLSPLSGELWRCQHSEPCGGAGVRGHDVWAELQLRMRRGIHRRRQPHLRRLQALGAERQLHRSFFALCLSVPQKDRGKA